MFSSVGFILQHLCKFAVPATIEKYESDVVTLAQSLKNYFVNFNAKLA